MDFQKQSKYRLLISTCVGLDLLILAFPFIIHNIFVMVHSVIISAFLMGVWLLLSIGFTIISLIYFLFQFLKKNEWKSSVPFLLNVTTLFVILFTPYFQVCKSIEHKIALQTNKPKYAAIIAHINNGTLKPYIVKNEKLAMYVYEDYYVELSTATEDFTLVDQPYINEEYSLKTPAETGNFILLDQSNSVTSVFFNYMSSVSFGIYSGFIYRSNNTPPPSTLFNLQWKNCVSYEPNWYYCDR